MESNDTAATLAKDFIHYTDQSIFLIGKAGRVPVKLLS